MKFNKNYIKSVNPTQNQKKKRKRFLHSKGFKCNSALYFLSWIFVLTFQVLVTYIFLNIFALKVIGAKLFNFFTCWVSLRIWWVEIYNNAILDAKPNRILALLRAIVVVTAIMVAIMINPGCKKEVSWYKKWSWLLVTKTRSIARNLCFE